MMDVRNISQARIPQGKRCLVLKMKRQALDTPVFRAPGHIVDGYRTSRKKPLRSSTWLRYLKRLALKAGLQNSLTQYVFRRGLVNAVNSKLSRVLNRSASQERLRC